MRTCLRWGSRVGSKKAQVLDTTTTTSPVTTTAGTLISLNIEVVLLVKLSQSKNKLLKLCDDLNNIYYYLLLMASTVHSMGRC